MKKYTKAQIKHNDWILLLIFVIVTIFVVSAKMILTHPFQIIKVTRIVSVEKEKCKSGFRYFQASLTLTTEKFIFGPDKVKTSPIKKIPVTNCVQCYEAL